MNNNKRAIIVGGLDLFAAITSICGLLEGVDGPSYSASWRIR
jgi:hypothetical protein